MKTKQYSEYPAGVSNAMHCWLKHCAGSRGHRARRFHGGLRSIDVLDATTAGLLIPAPEHSNLLYVATAEGREWLVANAINNGSSEAEALASLDFLEGT